VVHFQNVKRGPDAEIGENRYGISSYPVESNPPVNENGKKAVTIKICQNNNILSKYPAILISSIMLLI